jgi:Protein of unknown function (DUF669)
MAQFDTAFDASSVDPATAYEVLPAGRYQVQIVDSDLRVTKDGTGQYLWLMMDILEGEYQGRKVFDQLNLVNRNAQTVEIAQRTLSAICHATDRMQVSNSEELHLIPMTITVTVEPPKNGYGERNRIRYLTPGAAARGNGKAAASAPDRSQRPAAPAPTRTTAPAASATPTPRPGSAPWKRQG